MRQPGFGSTRTRKILLPCLIICLILPAMAQAGGLAVRHYSLDLKLDMPEQRIGGIVTIDFTLAAHGSVQLDMAQALEAASVSLDGASVKFTHADGILKLTVPVRAGGHRLEVRYAGQPDPRRLRFDKDPDGVVRYAASYGMPYSARQWWPSFDDPAVKAESADISIEVPAGLAAASNGTRMEVVPLSDGGHRYRWHEAYPIYADVISLAVAPYVEADDSYTSTTGKPLPLHYFMFKQDEKPAREEFAAVPGMLAAYETLFGPYPFQGEQYGIAEMQLQSFREHQTLPSLGRGFIEAPRAARVSDDVAAVIAHDLAHQWFGDSVTPTGWSDVWLNESFSNYAVALWQERAVGTAAYHDFMNALDSHDFTGSVHVADPKDFKAMFGTTTFNGGAWVLHMLRHVMGDQAFFTALRAYVQEHAYGSADTAVWRAACEKTYGHPLGWFFEEWVYGSGRPAYKLSWTQSGGTVTLHLEQTQTGRVFDMPLDVAVEDAGGTTLHILRLDQRTQDVTFTVQGSVKSMTLDPDHWVLHD